MEEGGGARERARKGTLRSCSANVQLKSTAAAVKAKTNCFFSHFLATAVSVDTRLARWSRLSFLPAASGRVPQLLSDSSASGRH